MNMALLRLSSSLLSSVSFQGLLPAACVDQLFAMLFAIPCAGQAQEEAVGVAEWSSDSSSAAGQQQQQVARLLSTVSSLMQPRSLQQCEEQVSCLRDLLPPQGHGGLSTSSAVASGALRVRQACFPLTEADCLKSLSSMLVPVRGQLID